MNSPSKRRRIDPDHPDADAIKEAADVIRRGGVALFPTRLLYGLGADAANPAAVDRIFDIKGRSPDKPILLLIARQDQLRDLVVDVPFSAEMLMERFWPGKLTLVFRAKPAVYTGLTAGTGKIGVRLCAHPVSAALADAVGGPITGTSANRSGEPGCGRVSDLNPEMLDALDLILDAGPLRGGAGSSVVDVTADPPSVLREGAVSKREILATIGQSFGKGIDINR